MTYGGGRAVQRVGLVVHGGRPEAREIAYRVALLCAECDAEAVELDVWGSPSTDLTSVSSEPLDLVITIGGDGTLLRGVRVAAPFDVPVLGINVGRVGFLTAVQPSEIDVALPAALCGQARVEERVVLGMRASRPLSVPTDISTLLQWGHGPPVSPVAAPEVLPDDPADPAAGVEIDVVALNDIVLDKLVRDRQASVAVYLSHKPFAQYSADALVVSSPTGSTAYSFAAGGPVLSPKLAGMIFTPVAPHMAFDRSLVVGPDEVVGMRVLDHSPQVVVSIDGQVRGVLDPGDWIKVHVGPRPARLLRIGEVDFYARLRERFHLADAPAAAADAAMSEE